MNILNYFIALKYDSIQNVQNARRKISEKQGVLCVRR